MRCLAPALLLVLSCTVCLANTTKVKSCYTLEKPYRKGIDDWRLTFKKVALIWKEEEDRLAAALLRARLITNGHFANNIYLYPPKLKPTDWSSWVYLEVRNLQWRVRLTPHAYTVPACKNASIWSFYEDGKLLRECDFIENPLNISSEHTTAYMVSDWQHMRAAKQIKELAPSSSKWINFVHIDRSYLGQLFYESKRSFFFYDVNYWSNYSGVQNVQLPPCTLCSAIANEIPFLLEGDVNSFNYKMLYGDNMFATIMLTQSTLSRVTQIASQNNISAQTAACMLVQQTPKPVGESRNSWAETIVAIVICMTERAEDLNEYMYLTSVLEDITQGFFKFHVFYIDCLDTALIIRKLHRLSENAWLNVVGVLLTDHVANAVLKEERFMFPLLIYDVSSGSIRQSSDRPVAYYATGNLTHLELGLRRLFADCGWQRLAVLSDHTRLAKALADELRRPHAGLTVRELSLNSTLEVHNALRELVNAKTRVFLVNTEEAMAGVILATAMKLNITRDAGYVWIVREYYAADNATAAIKPYSVSFWRRGSLVDKVDKIIKSDMQDKVAKTGEDVKKSQSGKTDENDEFEFLNGPTLPRVWQKQLESRWHDRAWPLHAAPIVDAFLTFHKVYKTPKWFHFKRFYNHSYNLPGRAVWFGVKIDNMLDLEYDGVKATLVFVQQWGAEPQPRVLATWPAGQWRESAESCPDVVAPTDDGSVYCLVPVGDPFHPSCQDAVWIASAILAAIVSAVLITIAIKRSRQALANRDQRVKLEFPKRMLARRERVFAALAAHLVDRSALELKQVLGTGRFGVVRLGLLRTPDNRSRTVVVATKALREDASPAEESEFLREACIVASFEHDHVVRFVGICVVDGPPLLLMEHAFFGDLLRYLQERRYLVQGATSAETESNEFRLEEKAHVSGEALTRLAQEAAAALAYIAQHGIVHRDVRASNCLVNERRSLKLGDFGLARAIGTVDGEYTCHRRGLFPVLWMAPESLATGISSAASDVWSFGVLVFELVTLGQRPYGAQPPPSVLQHVIAGGRPQLPRDTSAETLALVRACWRSAPEARPAAARLAEWLTERRRALHPALDADLVDFDAQIAGKSVSIELGTLPYPMII